MKKLREIRRKKNGEVGKRGEERRSPFGDRQCLEIQPKLVEKNLAFSAGRAGQGDPGRGVRGDSRMAEHRQHGTT